MLKREIGRNHQKYHAHSNNWWRGAEILKYIKQELVHFLCEPPYGPRDLEIVSDASAQVLWTLKKWKMSEDEEDYLEAFNELVRGNLVSIFVETLQGSFLSLLAPWCLDYLAPNWNSASWKLPLDIWKP